MFKAVFGFSGGRVTSKNAFKSHAGTRLFPRMHTTEFNVQGKEVLLVAW